MPSTMALLGKENLEFLIAKQFANTRDFCWGDGSVSFRHDGSLDMVNVQAVLDENLHLKTQLIAARAVIANQQLLLSEAIHGDV